LSDLGKQGGLLEIVMNRAVQLGSGGLEQPALRRAQKAIVADLDEAWRQDMLKEPANELFSGEGCQAGSAGGAVLVFEGDVAIVEAKDAVVADCNAKDVGGEVLKGGESGANRFKVDDPILTPDSVVDLI